MQQKADKLELRYVEGEIDRTLFEKYRDRNHQQIADLKQQAEQPSMNNSNLEKLINRGLQIAQNAGQLCLSSDNDGKQRLQYLTYPEGIRYHKQTHTVRTARIDTLFGSITRLQGFQRKIKRVPFKKRPPCSFGSLDSLPTVGRESLRA